MIARRRGTLIFLILVTSLLLLYQFHIYSDTNPGRSPISPYRTPSKADDGRFHWSDRAVHHPLQKYAQLPIGKPKQFPEVQYAFPVESAQHQTRRLERRQKVKDEFVRCWQSYRIHAWMHDELLPLSGKGRDTFGGWAATMVDALDTLWIMDMKEEFYEAAQSSMAIDFSMSTDDIVNIFETTIRYLGGFLAAYDLSADSRLLDKAVEVAEMLLVAFDTPNHLPITRWEWKKAAAGLPQVASENTLVSELGSLSLEFTRLSQLTGDMRWYDAIARITDLFYAQQNLTRIPGLYPVVVNPKDELLTGDTGFTLGGMTDSLYEYFPKEHVLLGGLLPVYQRLYENSVAAAARHLFFRPLTPDNADVLMSGDARAQADGSAPVLEPKFQHLTCFIGGVLGLGGRIFSNEGHVKLGRKLTDGCIWAYKNGPQGVMPEIAHFVPCPPDERCVWSRDKWEAAVVERHGSGAGKSDAASIIAEKKLPQGFTQIDDKRYILRPEAMESVFIMYRITGDESYRESAWEMFEAIRAITKTPLANAAIPDITATGPDGLPLKDDRMESFWLAETLKYLYLIFSEPALINLDEYLFNTEAHPFKRPV